MGRIILFFLEVRGRDAQKKTQQTKETNEIWIPYSNSHWEPSLLLSHEWKKQWLGLKSFFAAAFWSSHMLRPLKRKESNPDIYFKCSNCRNCFPFSNFLFSWISILPLCIWGRNHSLYLKRHYGHSQGFSFAIHYHFMDVTEALAVTKNEYIETEGKGDLGSCFFFPVYF